MEGSFGRVGARGIAMEGRFGTVSFSERVAVSPSWAGQEVLKGVWPTAADAWGGYSGGQAVIAMVSINLISIFCGSTAQPNEEIYYEVRFEKLVGFIQQHESLIHYMCSIIRVVNFCFLILLRCFELYYFDLSIFCFFFCFLLVSHSYLIIIGRLVSSLLKRLEVI
jgi:hypothetical protein